MYFSLKFNVWLGWIDYRLGFQNLNKVPYKNEIHEFAEKIWKPQIVFENNLQRKILRYQSESSFLMLTKNGHWKEAPLHQMDEARIFNPNETDILMQTVHLLKFKCSFDMYFFPFDHQTCFVTVSVEDTKQFYFHFPSFEFSFEFRSFREMDVAIKIHR